MSRRISHNEPPGGSASLSPSTLRAASIWGQGLACVAFIMTVVVRPGFAKEPAHTIRKSPFSSSTYRIWKEPRRGPTPRSLERVIKRNPPIGAHSQKLEEQGGRFTSERRAP